MSTEKIWEWNWQEPKPSDDLVHRLIEARAIISPSHPAVVSWDGEMTYAELDAFSSRLAGHLRACKVGPEVIVPICLPKSLWTIVSMLAVLKAGGAFVLLDTTLPEERLKMIVGQTGAMVALANPGTLQMCRQLAEDLEVLLVHMPLLDAMVQTVPFSQNHVKTSSQHSNAAYVMFTSGSTGKPKGVVVEHSQLATFSAECGKRLEYTSTSRVFQFSSYSFDLCIHEIIPTLVFGGTICIPSDWDRENDLVGSIDRLQVTHLSLTPTLLQVLHEAHVDFPSTIETMCLAGEMNPEPLVKHFASKIPRLVTCYGPTEATVWCTKAEFSPQWRTQSYEPVQGEIGTASGVRTWIVRENNLDELAEVGEVGELLLEGPLITRGYLNDPEKTATVFIPEPKWLKNSTRVNLSDLGRNKPLYRTGDRVKYLEDGSLCYLGRTDDQIKIRGQRLELSEVEKRLSEALEPETADSRGFEPRLGIERVLVDAVKLRGAVSTQLVAFLCVKASETMGFLDWHALASWDSDSEAPIVIRTTSEARQQFSSIVARVTERLELILPAYALPSVYVPLDSVPHTVSLKTDKARLRKIISKLSLQQLMLFHSEGPAVTQNGTDAPHKPEQWNDQENRLAGHWAAVFGIEITSIQKSSNFFVFGGESILAMKLVAISRASGLDLTVGVVLKYPILCDMAAHTNFLICTDTHDNQALVLEPFSLLGFSDAYELAEFGEQAKAKCYLKESGLSLEDIYPCSDSQTGLLLSYSRDFGAYLMQQLYRLPSNININPKRLKRAWSEVARRTACLRTRVFEHEGKFYQAVMADDPLQWTFIEDGRSLDAVLALEKCRRFEIGENMSWLTLVSEKHSNGGTAYSLIWTVHHALLDGWSTSLILSDVAEEYAQTEHRHEWAVNGNISVGQSPQHMVPPASLSSPPRALDLRPPLQNFIQHCIEQSHSRSAEEFWAQDLINTQTTAFPSLSSEVVPHATEVAEHASQISTTATTEYTPAILFQAAWCILIGIYAENFDELEGGLDIVTGMTLNGRSAHVRGIDRIAGPTITTVPFRIALHPNQALTEYLRSIRDRNFSILPHQHFGLQNIRRLNKGARAACQFHNLLVVQSATESMGPRKIFEDSSVSYSSVDCALMMECILQRPRRAHNTLDLPYLLRATFDSTIVPEARMQRILTQLDHLVQELAMASQGQRDHKKVSDLLYNACQADMRQIMEWNDLIYPSPLVTKLSCVHYLIQKQACISPESPAVCAWDGQLSYAKLDVLSTLLAVHLESSYGVRPETLVAICFEKSLWTVVAMLSVLKAGGGCVPLDPNGPPQRLKTVVGKLGNASASLALTSRAQVKRLSACLPAIRTLVVDAVLLDKLSPITVVPDSFRPMPMEDGDRVSLPFPLVKALPMPENTAFVVFTSGSTGVPKGIVLEHKAFCSSALAHGSLLGLGQHSRVLQFAAYTFDVSIDDIFGTLIHGGCVCILSDHDRVNNLAGAINSLGVNHLNLTPTVSAHLSPDEVPGVELLANAGEALPQAVLDIWADRVRLFNMYGPAECTIYAVIKGNIKRHDRPNDIGRGVGASAWIVDPKDPNGLLPVGGIGEILLEGPNLARGYLGDEELTAKSFICDPAWSISGSSPESGESRRFYRTGDLGKLNFDGSITFIGRNDGQVKLRGQRLEIGEIENQLQRLLPPLSKIAVVVVSPSDAPDKKILTAFIALAAQAGHCTALRSGSNSYEDVESIVELSPSVLRTFQSTLQEVDQNLRSILPTYMIPSAYIPITHLPISTSGKTDRRTLSSVATSLPQDRLASFLSPYNEAGSLKTGIASDRTPAELLLHQLWSDLFEPHRELLFTDHFFRLGGDSMMAMRLVSLARRQGIMLSVDKVFKNPVLEDLAGVAEPESEHESSSNAGTQVVPVESLSLLSGVDKEDLRRKAAYHCRIKLEMIHDIYPVTAIQERFMTGAFLGNMRNGTLDSYRQRVGPRDEQAQFSFGLPPSLDVEVFKKSWALLYARHDTLRTRMIETPGRIWQVVVNEGLLWTRWNGPLCDFLEDDERNAMVFGDRLFRVALVADRSAAVEARHFFVLSMSHAIYDGFSFQMLWEQVEAEYLRALESKVQDHSPEHLRSPQVPNESSLDTRAAPHILQMKQLVQRRMLADRGAALKFWKHELKDVDMKHIAPYDRLDRRILEKTRRRATVEIPKSSISSSNITLSTMIYVAAGLTLGRAYGSPDVIFEALLSGRSSDIPGIEGLMGPAMTCLPLRIRLDDASHRTVQDVLAATQKLLHTDLVTFEHIGWWDLVHMDGFKEILRHVPQINVNPNPFLDCGKGLGLKALGSPMNNEVFYAMSSFMEEGNLVLLISSDDAHVNPDDVQRHLRSWSTFLNELLRLRHEDESMTISTFFATHEE